LFTDKNSWRSHQIVSEPITVYGFWIADPKPAGIGPNTYVTTQRFLDAYYKPLDVPGDPYNTKYLAVTDPPQYVTVDRGESPVIIPEPATIFSPSESSVVQQAALGNTADYIRIAADDTLSMAAKNGFNWVAQYYPVMTGMLSGAPVTKVTVGVHESMITFGTSTGETVTVLVDTHTGELLEIRMPPNT